MRRSAITFGGFGAAVVALVILGLLEAAAQGTKGPSPCKGLDEKACRAKAAECRWIVPKKGKQRPYCRLGPRRKT